MDDKQQQALGRVRNLGDKIRRGDEAPGDRMVLDWATDIFYEPKREANRNRAPAGDGWWHLPMAGAMWEADARELERA